MLISSTGFSSGTARGWKGRRLCDILIMTWLDEVCTIILERWLLREYIWIPAFHSLIVPLYSRSYYTWIIRFLISENQTIAWKPVICLKWVEPRGGGGFSEPLFSCGTCDNNPSRSENFTAMRNDSDNFLYFSLLRHDWKESYILCWLPHITNKNMI